MSLYLPLTERFTTVRYLLVSGSYCTVKEVIERTITSKSGRYCTVVKSLATPPEQVLRVNEHRFV